MDIETLKDAAFGPLYLHVEHLNQLEDRSEALEMFVPETLTQLIQEGLNDGWWAVNDAYVETRSALHQWADAAISQANSITPFWEEAQARHNGAFFEGVKAGVFSEESQIGAAIGTALLPGVGTFVGAALGGLVAGNKVDKQTDEAFSNLITVFNEWYAASQDNFSNLVSPALAHDVYEIERALAEASVTDTATGTPRSSGFKIAALIGATALAGFLIYYFAFADRGQVEEAIVAEPVAPEPPPLAHIEGMWQSSSGVQFQVEKQGDRYALNEMGSEGPQSTVFMLTPTDENSFSVRQNARGEHVRKLPFHPDAEESCRRIVAQVDGEPLRARLSGDTLIMDAVTIELKNEHVRRRGGRIVECTSLGDAPIFLREVALKVVR